MSHIVTIETELRDPAAIRTACRRMKLAEPVDGTYTLFAGQRATGLAAMLPGWRFPVVADTSTGKLAYDNYGGSWGKTEELDHFKQAYAVEKAKLEARRAGHSVRETPLADGSVRLTLTT